MEQLAAAGIDVDNMSELTEDQLNSLIALANQAENTQQQTTAVVDTIGVERNNRGGTGAPKSELVTTHRHHQPHQQSNDTVDSSDSLTMVIGEDGSLKLSDGSGQHFYVSYVEITANILSAII